MTSPPVPRADGAQLALPAVFAEYMGAASQGRSRLQSHSVVPSPDPVWILHMTENGVKCNGSTALVYIDM